MKRIIVADALDGLRSLPDASVQAIVTSPPYWRQRDYKAVGQLGLEATPEEYVSRLVAILREARRVLRDDGTLWLNLGDGWANDGKWGGKTGGKHVTGLHGLDGPGRRRVKTGLKPKDLIGLPWMTAFALRADGWFLRQRNVWAKPSGMPESVTDRSTVSCEEVFHLSKRADYFYDNVAARTPPAPATETRLALRANGGGKTNGPMKAVRKGDADRPDKQRGHSLRDVGFNDRWDQIAREQQQRGGANLRNVWWVAPAQFREAHFAVMPERIAELCIIPSTRVGDTVLDPFAGAGTTGLVAKRLGRDFIGIELNPPYARLAERRIARGPAYQETLDLA